MDETDSLASTGKYKVRGLVRNLEKAKEALSSAGDGLEIELEQGDILDEESLGTAMKVRREGTAPTLAVERTVLLRFERGTHTHTRSTVKLRKQAKCDCSVSAL